jgi:hypothetical protein
MFVRARAPILNIELECPSEWKPEAVIDPIIKVTYVVVANEGDPRL